MLFGDISFPIFPGPQYPIRFFYTMLHCLPGHLDKRTCSRNGDFLRGLIFTLGYKLTEYPSREFNAIGNRGINPVDKHGCPSSIIMIQNDKQVLTGEDKPFPSPLPDLEDHVVEFEKTDDPDHPQNWRLSIKSVRYRIDLIIKYSEC